MTPAEPSLAPGSTGGFTAHLSFFGSFLNPFFATKNEHCFWFGIALVSIGLAFRLYAITVLGRYFTPSVTVVADQKLVEDGPYKLIRHPAYTGLLIMFLGFGLGSTNWLSLLALMGCALLGLSYRIYVEEHALLAHLGLPYQEYMQRTKRLIPFVL